MTVGIYLLGAPRVERDGIAQAAPKGRKMWALLAYLLLSESPPQRTRLASLLFSEADDPLRALRWNLTAVRRLLGPESHVDGDPVTLHLPPGAFVDALLLTRGTWVEALAIPALGEELLAGMDFSTAGSFEPWLLNQRRHLQAATAAVLQEGTLARLAIGDAEPAIDLATRLVRLEPLAEDHHALLVRSLTAAGDHAGARRQIGLCREIFRRELGVEPTGVVAAAVQLPAYTPPAAQGLVAIRAQMEAGAAAIRAGANDVGLAYLRQAAAESHVVGDHVLQAQALLTMGSEMVHASRGRQLEGATALHRVLVLAEDHGDEELAATVYHHLAWVDLMACRFAPMHRKLDQAAALHVEDDSTRIWGHLTRGLGYLASAHYVEAERALRELVAIARRTGETRLISFGISVLAGVFLHRGEYDQARQLAQEAADLAAASGSLALIALTTAKLGEVELAEGSVGVGRPLAERAMALSDQIHETCVQSMAGVQLGLLDLTRGDLDRAVAHLAAAWSKPVLLPDHVWKGALALETLCDVAVREKLPHARKWVTDLESLAGRTGMRELLTKAYLLRHRLGDDTAEAAALLAAEIENPLLHEQVRAATGARIAVAAG